MRPASGETLHTVCVMRGEVKTIHTTRALWMFPSFRVCRQDSSMQVCNARRVITLGMIARSARPDPLFAFLFPYLAFVLDPTGDPDDLVPLGTRGRILDSWTDTSSLSLLNLTYDVTSADLVTMVITELGLLPCTSVPVVLRVINAETDI